MGEERTGLVTDRRAALEEAAEKFWQEKHARAKCNVLPIRSVLADFAEKQLEAAWREARLCDDIALDQPLDKIISEVQADRERLWAENRDLIQESSSLKLLLSAIQKGIVEFGYVRGARILFFREIHKIFPVELDSSGIPVLTPEIIEALKNAAIF